MKNVLVAQSGGPTAVINNTLRGIVETARDTSGFGKVFAARHGIEGVLREELLNLSDQSPDEIALLETTPGSGVTGTSRYKLREDRPEDFHRVLEVLRMHEIGYFLYIGGNDSMGTADRICQFAKRVGLDLCVIGVPKTIDNDVGDKDFELIDHTPGYGSVARYWRDYLLCANEENKGSCTSDPVLVLQSMGRSIGFIAAATRLADTDRLLPLQIYLPECQIGLNDVHDQVNESLKEHGRCIVVVSEGTHFDGLELPEKQLEHDDFGHPMFSSSKITVAQLLTNSLNSRNLVVNGRARCNVAGTDQRSSIIHASPVDLSEAWNVGQQAIRLASDNQNGCMATIRRLHREEYGVSFGKCPLCEVAGLEREFPVRWISDCGYDVSDDFVTYAMPLIGEFPVQIPLVDGRFRFARLNVKPEMYASQNLPPWSLNGRPKS